VDSFHRVECPSCRVTSHVVPQQGETHIDALLRIRQRHVKAGCSHYSLAQWGYVSSWDAPKEPQWIVLDKSSLVFDKKEGVHRLLPVRS
jgi:hypothetical protein